MVCRNAMEDVFFLVLLDEVEKKKALNSFFFVCLDYVTVGFGCTVQNFPQVIFHWLTCTKQIDEPQIVHKNFESIQQTSD